MSQKILITGITGFVGSHMADFILKSGNNNYEIFGTKRYHLSRIDKVEHFFDKITWYDCDFTDPISTEKVINEIKPDKTRVINAVTNGIGVMPAYEGQLSTEEIEAVAHYVSISVNQ